MEVRGSGPQMKMLKDKHVKDLMSEKRRLVEVPYSATLADTMNTLMANKVVAVPVAAPPGQWIGAGGSMILESDKQTGAVRKHYIGMVTMLDILAHIAENEDPRLTTVPVSSIIGHCLESLSLWTLSPNTSILDCMEVFSKGIHRAMVPVDGQLENVGGVELMESASCYRMLTQMDVLKYLKENFQEELKGIMLHKVSDNQLQAVSDSVYGVTNKAKVIHVIKCMRMGALHAVPIVESSGEEDHTQLVNGKKKKIMGTFSATDLRGCPVAQLQPFLNEGVVDFLKRVSETPMYESTGLRCSWRELVSCRPESTLGEALEKAVSSHVHRVWVVDEQGLLEGVVSLTDMIRVIRLSYLTQYLQ